MTLQVTLLVIPLPFSTSRSSFGGSAPACEEPLAQRSRPGSGAGQEDGLCGDPTIAGWRATSLHSLMVWRTDATYKVPPMALLHPPDPLAQPSWGISTPSRERVRGNRHSRPLRAAASCSVLTVLCLVGRVEWL